jgi:putative tricarboxylic transport membrane protein
MFEGAAEAIGSLSTWEGLLILVAGTSIGLIVAVLPGISGLNAMALLLPLTFTMDKTHALTFMVTIMAAGGFAGSVTSILMNVPGDPVNAATTLDGHPLARRGRAGEAIGASATASALGALFGLILLALSLPFLRQIILFFGPPELFAFSIAGIALIGTVATGSRLKGLIAGAVGLLLGAVGFNLVSGGIRYTFGVLPLFEGIPLVAAIMGLFALPELFELMRTNQSVSRTGEVVRGGVGRGIRAVLARPLLLLRSSALGTAIGIVPGVGSSVASWVAYFAARNTSRNPESFGKGNIEGVIGPDAAIDAKEGGSMMPLLALGIPGSLSTALLLSAFFIHGIAPGQRLFQNDMPLIWAMILAMVFANIATSALGLVSANQLVKFTLVPAAVIAPIVLVLALLGSYVETQAFFSILVFLVFGVLGLVMVHLGYPRPPLLLGIVLLPIAEDNFHTSFQIYRDSYAFLLRPITLGVLLLTAFALTIPWLRRRWQERRDTPHLRNSTGTSINNAARAEELSDEELDSRPSKLSRWDFVAQLVLLAAAIGLVVESFNYTPDARLFPLLILAVLITLVSILFLKTLVAWRTRESGRRTDSDASQEEPPRPAWVALLWIGMLPILVWAVGMALATFLYVAVFLTVFDWKGWSATRILFNLAAAVVMTGLVYYVFGELLGIKLPLGTLI